MTPDKVRAVMEKEFDEIMKNKYILLTLVLAPLIIAIVLPATMILPAVFTPDSFLSSGKMSYLAQTFGNGAGSQDQLILFLMTTMLPVFLILPAVLPTLIASYGVIGEKKNRTLEPLLAAPVTVYDILIGKALSAVIPALLVTWISAVVFFAIAELIIYSGLHRLIFPDPVLWAAGMLILAPLLAFLGVIVATIISSRVNDPRVAQQISVVFLLPIMAVFISQLSGFLLIDARLLAVGAVAVFIADLALVRLSKPLFEREEILTRWK